MKVYIITTKYIGDNCLFNTRNEHRIIGKDRPANGCFNDLRYDNVDDREHCHGFYYKIGNENDICNVIGLPFLPNMNNGQRLDRWKEWLRSLCPGDNNEYTFILHDKDCTNCDTSFSRYGNNGDTYVFMHANCDCFYRLLKGCDNGIDANAFGERFQKLVGLNDMYNKIDSFLREEKTPERKIFEEVDELLGNNQKYANQFDSCTDIEQLLSDIRDIIEDAI